MRKIKSILFWALILGTSSLMAAPQMRRPNVIYKGRMPMRQSVVKTQPNVVYKGRTPIYNHKALGAMPPPSKSDFRKAPPPPPKRIFHRPPPVRHIYRPLPPPPRWRHSSWLAISYFAGTTIIDCVRPRTVTYITYPRRVTVVETAPIEIQETSIVDANSLRADLQSLLAQDLKDFPYSVKVNSFEIKNGVISANITINVTINNNKYNIATGAESSNYDTLKEYFASEVSRAVSSIVNPSQTTITKE